MTATDRIWREPATESDKLYPGLSLNDNRVTGSIVVDHSRLPLWAIVYTAITQGWDEVEHGWEPGEHYGFKAEDMAEFLYNLLELRGEFGRLLLVLADAERRERGLGYKPWWMTKKHRKRVGDQLRRCLACLHDEHSPHGEEAT